MLEARYEVERELDIPCVGETEDGPDRSGEGYERPPTIDQRLYNLELGGNPSSGGLRDIGWLCKEDGGRDGGFLPVGSLR
jgi:hypothetical protein